MKLKLCKKCGIEYECQKGTDGDINGVCARCFFDTKGKIILTKRQYTHEEVMKILYDHNIEFDFDDSDEAKEKAKELHNKTKHLHRLGGRR